MTHLEKVQSLLTELGIVYTRNEEWDEEDAVLRLNILAKNGPKQFGYSNFETVFTFELDGTFINIGLWE